MYCTWLLVTSVALSRAYLCRNGKHDLFFCIQYRQTQVEWKNYWVFLLEKQSELHSLLISIDMLLILSTTKGKTWDCSGLLTCYRWWNQYGLVADVQSFLLFRYWIYYSATRCVLKNSPNNPGVLTEWFLCDLCFFVNCKCGVLLILLFTVASDRVTAISANELIFSRVKEEWGRM